VSAVRATCSVHFFLLDLFVLVILGEGYNYFLFRVSCQIMYPIPRSFVAFRTTLVPLIGGLINPPPQPPARRPLFVGCLLLLVHHIRSVGAVCIRYLRMHHTLLTWRSRDVDNVGFLDFVFTYDQLFPFHYNRIS